MLKSRILTALILIPIVIAAIFLLPPISFLCLVMLVILLAGWEWTALAGINQVMIKTIYLALLAALLLLTLFTPIVFVIVSGIAWWLLAFIMLILYPKWSGWWGNHSWVRSLMGVLVLVPCWIALLILQGFSPMVLLFCLIMIWAVDSAAYFVGKNGVNINLLLPSVLENPMKVLLRGSSWPW